MSSGKTYNHSVPITGRTNLSRNTSAEESENGHHTSEMVISDGNSYDLERAAATHLHRYQASDMLLNHPGLVFSSSHMQNHSRQLNRYGFNNNNENKDLSPNRGRKTPSLESLSNSHGTSNRSQSVDGDSKKDSDTKTKKRSSSAEDLKQDQTYWEKRRKNNESAKRSRDARRMKEEQIAMRVVYLEQENLQLRTEAQLLKNEIDKLRCMLYNAQ